MCGIIGYTGEKQAAAILLEGLSRLEYRGYDSAGIGVFDESTRPAVRKSAGKLSALKETLGDGLLPGMTGVGHTRWATHGAPTDSNAHPHVDCQDDVVVVHNGIVENYMELRQELISESHAFASETDSECIPHLVESYQQQGYSFEESMSQTASRIRGANAIVA